MGMYIFEGQGSGYGKDMKTNGRVGISENNSSSVRAFP